MSTIDTLIPLISGPWLDPTGSQESSLPVPGLSVEAVHTLERCFSPTISEQRRELLKVCSGLHNTPIGSIDFTGCCFPAESLSVFQPCITLAIDDEGRRWIAETAGDGQVTGRVWCVFPSPEVALLVANDLRHFLSVLRDHTGADTALSWLQTLTAEARRIWAERHALAVRPDRAPEVDEEIRAWIATLPKDAFVYDLRQEAASGWPYGVLGSAGRLYRCGRLPVFAVTGWFVDTPNFPRPAQHLPGSTARDLPARTLTTTDARNPHRMAPWLRPMKISASLHKRRSTGIPRYRSAVVLCP